MHDLNRFILLCCLLASVFAFAEEPVPADSYEHHIKAGRALFASRNFSKATEAFTEALSAKPADRDARFFAGLSAYWAQESRLALAHWNALLSKTKRNSPEEWELNRHRLLALYALNEADAADLIVERMYELRLEVKLKTAVDAKGFVRENIYVGAMRAGVWEVFDDRNEQQIAWSIPVSTLQAGEKSKAPIENVVKQITIETVPLPSGGAGYALTEESGDMRRTYARWIQKPPYQSIRKLVVQLLEGKLKPVEEKKLATVPPPAEIVAPSAKYAELPPDAARIMAIAERLRDVSFDVTKMARTSLADPQLAERMFNELEAKQPRAQADAKALSEEVMKVKAEFLASAMKVILSQPARSAYLDFTLLTGLNSRATGVEKEWLAQFAKSGDFLVRETALSMLARRGDKDALGKLFAEGAAADLLSATFIHGAVEDLLGPICQAPPRPGSALPDENLAIWRRKTAAWWETNSGAIKYSADPKPGNPYWSK